MQDHIRLYRYRWVVLAVYSLLTVAISIQWLTFAAIQRDARAFYGVTTLEIDALSLIFLVVFLFVAFPASFLIDTNGLRVGVGVGAVLTGIFGLMKGIFAESYTMVVVAQLGLAVAQPFIINAATKLSVLWFPLEERASAVAVGTLAQFLGFIVVMIATPLLVGSGPNGHGVPFALMIYGFVSVAAAILFLLFARERPPTSMGTHGEDAKLPLKKAVLHMLRQKDMQKMTLIFFIGLGIFNGISTCIDQLCEARHLTEDQTGIVGGVMLIAGIVGGVILPPLSDRLRRRRPFLILSSVGFLAGIAIFMFMSGFIPLLVGSIVMGFFLLGAGAPVGFQYCAEVTAPASESSSQGLLLLIGQISGIALIVSINTFGALDFPKLLVGLAALNVIGSFLLKESPFMTGAGEN